MAEVLFVTWDGGGNVSPALEMARELAARGDHVRFLGQASQSESVSKAGFEFESYRRPGRWTATRECTALQSSLAFLQVLTNRGFGSDLLSSIERTHTDLVVIDCLLDGALLAAGKAGIRHAILVHSLFGAVSRTMASGPAGTIAQLAGYRPRRMWASADLVLVATLKQLDLPPRRADARISLSYTGPVLPEDIAAPIRPEVPATVLVSMSTTFIPGQDRILQAALDALATLPVRGVVTTGPALDRAALRVPANTEAHGYVPHSSLMPISSLVVGHGGHATTMMALAHDLPLVIIPANRQFDQPTIGRVIDDIGAGILLPTSASAEAIRDAVEKVLGSPSYRVEAARLGELIRASRGAAVAADRLHALAVS